MCKWYVDMYSVLVKIFEKKRWWIYKKNYFYFRYDESLNDKK